MSKIQFEQSTKKDKGKIMSLMVQNNVIYVIAVIEGKHEFKKVPQFKKTKKWHVPIILKSVELISKEVASQMIKFDPLNHNKLNKVLAMKTDKTYWFLLAESQYEFLKAWIDVNEVGLNQDFEMKREGTLYDTMYRFNRIDIVVPKPKATKPKSTKPKIE